VGQLQGPRSYGYELRRLRGQHRHPGGDDWRHWHPVAHSQRHAHDPNFHADGDRDFHCASFEHIHAEPNFQPDAHSDPHSDADSKSNPDHNGHVDTIPHTHGDADAHRIAPYDTIADVEPNSYGWRTRHIDGYSKCDTHCRPHSNADDGSDPNSESHVRSQPIGHSRYGGAVAFTHVHTAAGHARRLSEPHLVHGDPGRHGHVRAAGANANVGNSRTDHPDAD
jgi:hypothetical protein